MRRSGASHALRNLLEIKIARNAYGGNVLPFFCPSGRVQPPGRTHGPHNSGRRQISRGPHRPQKVHSATSVRISSTAASMPARVTSDKSSPCAKFPAGTLSSQPAGAVP